MAYFIFFAVLFVFFVLYVIRCKIEDRNRVKRFEQRLREDFGLPSEKKYLDGRLETLSQQYHKEEGQFFLDDITWNDLDLDRVFMKMDYTLSSAGEEELYTIFRTPVSDEETLKERDRIACYFMEHEEERVKLSLYYARVGRTGKYSIYDYIAFLDSMEERSNQKHIGVLMLMAFATALCFVNPAYGLMILAVLFSYNIVTYMKEQADNSPYITTFAYFVRILHMVKELESYELPVIQNLLDELHKKRRDFDGFLRFSWLVTNADGASSDPLSLIMDYVKMAFHLNLIKFNLMLNEAKSKKDDIVFMIRTIGYIEAMISIANYRASLKESCQPVFDGGKQEFIATGIYHPLIEEPVTNSLHLQKSMLLTGSNASGKSTFLKTVAIAQILAQTIYTVPAKECRTSFYQVYTSMSLRDDLASADSYFIVEIKALKRIVDEVAKGQADIMCFVDEVLRGTNTVERIAASTEILSNLHSEGAFCFAATHDIELTRLLQESFSNYHFEETIQNNDVKFNYLLLEGRATSRNAIKLLGVLGYEDSIIENAQGRAQAFLEKGEWV